MRPIQTIGVLAAIGMAVLFAPAAVSAKSNLLSAPSVSPTSGTTATTFTFRVSYVGFAAQSVSVTVAGVTLPMSLVSGNRTDGVFAVSTRLPAGRWTVRFSASAPKGPQPSLQGPNVVVSSPSVSPPAPPATTPRPTLSAPAAPAASPIQSTMPSSGQPIAGSSSAASSAAAIPHRASPAAVGAGIATNPSPGPGGAAGGTARPAAGKVGVGRPSSDTPGPGGGSLSTSGDATLWEILLVGLMTVGAVALGGAAWLLAAHRRQRSTAGAEGGGLHVDGDLEPDLPSREPALRLRSDRRSRLDAADDPILEGMGLSRHGDERSTVPGSQVNAGPGVRPPLWTRRSGGS